MKQLLASLLLTAAFGGGVAAGPLDAIYADADVADLAPRYERGWLGNYENVFRPAFTAEEKRRLDGTRLRMQWRIDNVEPFGFMAGGGMIIVSAASLRFLEDVAMAYIWLDVKGYSTQTLADYLLMLRAWDGPKIPPKPWQALCIPDDAFDDPEVADRARRAFDTAAAFALLHEYGHILYSHPGNTAVPANVSRANEQAADRFAFDQIVRIGDMPIGVPILFFMMAHLQENRADYASDEAYRITLAARTHPVSPERLQSLARHMSHWTSAYEGNFRPGAQASALAIALEISQFGHLLDDPGVQWLSNRIGSTVRPEDLAPRPRGRHLAPPCGIGIGGGSDFHGLLRGEISDGTTPFEMDVVLQRRGSEVTGTYSYGAGFGRLEGTIENATLSYRWTLSPDGGMGRIVLENGEYRGTWGIGSADSGGGTILLRR